MGHGGAVEAERLHHAVAVEPVAVAKPEPLVNGRPVAVERPPERGRQPPLDPGRTVEPIRGSALPAEQHGVGGEPRGELRGPVVAGRRTAGEGPA